MSNILVVESKNDKFFVEAIINHLNLKNIEVEEWTICIADYECLEGTGNLEETLKTLKNKIIKDEIDKVGIILDLDKHTIDKRLEDVNKAIDTVFTENYQNNLVRQNSFITLSADETFTFELACYFVNLNGRGEVEDILKEIKIAPSPHADCLDNWNQCLSNKQVKPDFKEKDLLKEWVRFYIRYDTCKGRERNQAGRKCSMEVALQKKNIWDFDHQCLNELKTFLEMFK